MEAELRGATSREFLLKATREASMRRIGLHSASGFPAGSPQKNQARCATDLNFAAVLGVPASLR